MKRFIAFLIVIGLLCCLVSSGFCKDLKIGYVDIFKIFNEYKKTEDYDKKLEKKKNEAEKKLDEKKETIKKIQGKLSLLKDKEREKEEQKISKEVESYRELERKAFVDIKKERDEKMKEIVEDINKIVEEYAKKHGYDLIVNENAILYGDKVMDITTDILKISNQKYKK